MDEATRKPMLTPRQPLIEAVWRGQNEQRPPKPLVGGSIPSGPAKLSGRACRCARQLLR